MYAPKKEGRPLFFLLPTPSLHSPKEEGRSNSPHIYLHATDGGGGGRGGGAIWSKYGRGGERTKERLRIYATDEEDIYVGDDFACLPRRKKAVGRMCAMHACAHPAATQQATLLFPLICSRVIGHTSIVVLFLGGGFPLLPLSSCFLSASFCLSPLFHFRVCKKREKPPLSFPPTFPQKFVWETRV